jgi:hypothetical protein
LFGFKIERQPETGRSIILKRVVSTSQPLKCLITFRQDKKSRVKGDFQARFCGNAGVKLPCVTRLAAILPRQNQDFFDRFFAKIDISIVSL